MFVRALTVVLIMGTAAIGEPWKLSIESNVTVSLNTYSDNWTGGDAGSFSWAAKMLAVAEKQLSEKINTENTLKLAFGQTKTQDTETDQWSVPTKSTDLIDFETVLTFTLGAWVDPYLSGRVVSQFVDPYVESNGESDTLYGNPVDITESFGVARDFVESDKLKLSSRVGAAFRQNIDRKRPEDSLTTTDGGLEWVTKLKWEPHESFSYSSELQVFEALFRIDAPEESSEWRHPDVNWENSISVNLTKFIMVSYYLQLLYDIEEPGAKKRARFKQTLGAGLTFNAKWPGEGEEGE